MPVDDTPRRWCNTIHGTPRSVFWEKPGSDVEVAWPEVIPADTGLYWVAGTTTVACGREVASVFIVDTDSSGELSAVFWTVEDGEWIDSQDEDAPARLGLERSEVFPFDWSYAIPLEQDASKPPGAG